MRLPGPTHWFRRAGLRRAFPALEPNRLISSVALRPDRAPKARRLARVPSSSSFRDALLRTSGYRRFARDHRRTHALAAQEGPSKLQPRAPAATWIRFVALWSLNATVLAAASSLTPMKIRISSPSTRAKGHSGGSSSGLRPRSLAGICRQRKVPGKNSCRVRIEVKALEYECERHAAEAGNWPCSPTPKTRPRRRSQASRPART